MKQFLILMGVSACCLLGYAEQTKADSREKPTTLAENASKEKPPAKDPDEIKRIERRKQLAQKFETEAKERDDLIVATEQNIEKLEKRKENLIAADLAEQARAKSRALAQSNEESAAAEAIERKLALEKEELEKEGKALQIRTDALLKKDRASRGYAKADLLKLTYDVVDKLCIVRLENADQYAIKNIGLSVVHIRDGAPVRRDHYMPICAEVGDKPLQPQEKRDIEFPVVPPPNTEPKIKLMEVEYADGEKLSGVAHRPDGFSQAPGLQKRIRDAISKRYREGRDIEEILESKSKVVEEEKKLSKRRQKANSLEEYLALEQETTQVHERYEMWTKRFNKQIAKEAAAKDYVAKGLFKQDINLRGKTYYALFSNNGSWTVENILLKVAYIRNGETLRKDTVMAICSEAGDEPLFPKSTREVPLVLDIPVDSMPEFTLFQIELEEQPINQP